MIQTDQLSVKRDYHATIGTEVQIRKNREKPCRAQNGNKERLLSEK